jgi:hypothetical protein
MLQASVFDRFALDALALGEDGLGPPEVDIGRGQFVEALMVAGVIVMLDEGADLPFEIARQVVVVEQDAVLQGLVSALDLALRLRMISSAYDLSVHHSGHLTFRGVRVAPRTVR